MTTQRDMETAREIAERAMRDFKEAAAQENRSSLGIVRARIAERIAAALAKEREWCADVVRQMEDAEARAYQATHRQYHADRACALHEAEAAIRAGSAP